MQYREFELQVQKLLEPTTLCFHKIAKKYLLFHLSFAFILTCEIALMTIFFLPLIDSFFLGAAIAFFFFTILLYFILRLYYQDQKPEELKALVSEFIQTCQKFLPTGMSYFDEHLSLATCALKMADQIQLQGVVISFPKFLSPVEPLLQKVSQLLLWRDNMRMKELLLHAGLEQHLKLIKTDPTNLDAHAQAIQGYLASAAFYQECAKFAKESGYSKDLLKRFETKLHDSYARAIEELTILRHFAPQEPWVLEQLAKCYEALNRRDEEITMYEELIQLQPSHHQALFRLGKLYFQKGANAKGLTIYGELKQERPERADELIGFYGIAALT